jgi:signal transduction histidine kinase
MNLSAQHPSSVCSSALPWDSMSSATVWERDLAAAALFFAESLELPLVLDRVAQRVAALFGGVCHVHFTPTNRPKEALRAIAGAAEDDTRRSTAMAGETYISRATWFDEQSSSPALQAMMDEPVVSQQETILANGPNTVSELLLLVPLVARSRRIGSIDVVIHVPFGYDLSVGQRRLSELAAFAALAMSTADRFAQLRPTAVETDGSAAVDEYDTLLDIIAHDLKGPLTTLKSSTQLLVRATKDGKKPRGETMARLVEIVEAAVDQMEAQIFTLTPVPVVRRRGDDKPAPTLDFVGLVHQQAHFYQETTTRHWLVVIPEVNELLGPWLRGHLERVVGNLLTNAIKYSPDGGEIQITIGREEDANGSWATLSVRNLGIGIHARDMVQLSQPGYRAKNVGEIPGTGLGLASVREIVTQYNGMCAIQSTYRGATVVQVRLPLDGGAQG